MKMRKTKILCKHKACGLPVEMAGFCVAHYQEDLENRRQETVAINTLHSQSGAITIKNRELSEELSRLKGLWDIACHAANSNIKNTVLKDQAPYAVEWCISLAKELILADRALIEGRAVSGSLEYTRNSVWSRFAEIDSQLVKRDAK
jgi:hypothetical protein